MMDAALLTWLTVVPPDRVGVARKLQLGVTLKPGAAGGGGFELDLSTPDAHKTAALFGPSTTAVPAAACGRAPAGVAGRGGAHHHRDGQAVRLRAGQPRARHRRPRQAARRAALD